MMGLFDVIKGKGAAQCPTTAVDNTAVPKQLHFYSTGAMERGLDGTEETFARFHWTMYHCSPDEPAVNDRREQLRKQYPNKAARLARDSFCWAKPLIRLWVVITERRPRVTLQSLAANTIASSSTESGRRT
jgi:hypothetical protein